MIDYVRFTSHLIVERGIGSICTASYSGAVKRFVKATGIEKPTKDDVINYLMGFYTANKSYSHITNTTLALERYMEFIGTPIQLGRPHKPKRIVVGTLTETEIARMFSLCRNIRERALLGMLAYTGIRNLELCNLPVKDIDFQNNTVFIKGGKGQKDGIVCISSDCLAVITEYLKEYPRQNEETLFFTIARNKKHDKLNTATVRKFIKQIAKRAGIQKRVWPHLFRHSLAMNMLMKGCDIYSIREQLRHSYISTTFIYIHSNPKIMQNKYQVFCPSYMWEATKSPFIINNNQYYIKK
jgi:integrase/recombinase XerD